MRTLLLTAVLSASCFACSQKRAIPIDQAQAMTQKFAQALMGELQRAIGAEGPAHAIGVCADAAPEIAQQVATTDLSVRRIGTRVRNAERNTPTAAELAILKTLSPEAPIYSGTIEGQEKFVQGIFIPNGMCLVCHGKRETIAPEVLASLAERYPLDEAFGYQVGDLRGALIVERKQQP